MYWKFVLINRSIYNMTINDSDWYQYLCVASNNWNALKYPEFMFAS